MNDFPYTNFHELNQDWIIKQTRDNTTDITNIKQRLENIPPDVESEIATINSEIDALQNEIENISSLYLCTFGVTTNSEIESALNDKKLPICIYNGHIYVISQRVTANRHRFGSVYRTESAALECLLDSWLTQNDTFASTTYVDSAIAAIPPEVFVAVYEQTSYADLLAAYNDGKYIVMKRQDDPDFPDANFAVFAFFESDEFFFYDMNPTTRQFNRYRRNATDWYIQQQGTLALTNSPTFIGTPKAPTAATGTNTTQIATTAFVQNSISEFEIIDTASGNIASFPDGANSIPLLGLKVGIAPFQDLHGQDSPYLPGDGKNKIPTTINTQTLNDVTITVNTDGTITLSGTASANTEVTVGSTTLESGNYKLTGCPYPDTSCRLMVKYNSESGAALALQYNNQDIAFTASNSGTYYLRLFILNGTNVTGTTIKPMIRLSSVTDATYAPYSNTCPISGWSEVTVIRTGANVWDEEWEVGGLVPNQVNSKNYIPVKPETTYYTTVPFTAYFYDINKNLISSSWVQPFTTPPGCYYMKFRCPTAYGTTYNNDISINYPSTDTSYHAHETALNVTIDLSGTRLGGILDVKTGILTVTMAEIASYAGETIGEPWWSSMDKYVPGGTPTTGAQVVYTLANPSTTVQLTANPLFNTLPGTNNIWNNTNNLGETEATYHANLQKYIEKKLS